ncbi:MAG: hypothetical protein ACREBC_25180, partial [Pyrinomonadaceae bacterium]
VVQRAKARARERQEGQLLDLRNGLYDLKRVADAAMEVLESGRVEGITRDRELMCFCYRTGCDALAQTMKRLGAKSKG